MKYFILMLALATQTLWASERNNFITMDDLDKIEFIHEKAEEVYQDDEIRKFELQNPKLVSLIQEIGFDRARVWGDTVLEGPYAQTGELEVKISSLYFVDDELYAVRASVSADAIMYDINDCEYNDDLEEWTGDCAEGYISEGLYIDFEGNFIESDEYADFDS